MRCGLWSRWAFFGLLSWLSLFQVSAASAEDFQVFAAASLTDALQAISQEYAKISPDHPTFNFAGSSTLARQIDEGAPADLFFSADLAKMETLLKKSRITPDSVRPLVANTLVVVVASGRAGAWKSAAELLDPKWKKIALGQPETVPAGIYAREFLVAQKLWDPLQPRVVPCENVRAVLAAVEAGNCEAGFVYATDAAISKKVSVALTIPQSDGPQIVYPAGLVAESKHTATAARFLDFLAGADAQKIFASFGFLPAPNTPKR